MDARTVSATVGVPGQVAPQVHPPIALLQAALGSDADPVHFVDMAQLGRNPACIIPAWRSFVEERATSGQRVRGTGEPIWSRRRLQDVNECTRLFLGLRSDHAFMARVGHRVTGGGWSAP